MTNNTGKYYVADLPMMISTGKDSARAQGQPIEKADERHKRDLFSAFWDEGPERAIWQICDMFRKEHCAKPKTGEAK